MLEIPDIFGCMVGAGPEPRYEEKIKPLGVSPLTAISMYRKITVPTVLYGCEVWYNFHKPNLSNLTVFNDTLRNAYKVSPCVLEQIYASQC